MVDIDERVVQLKFDSSDFEKNTKTTFSILDKLREKLTFKDVTNDDAMINIANNVQKVADKAYTIVDRMIDKIKDDIANKLVGFLRENTVGQLASGWNKYADMTTSVATLKAQGYAMEDINEQLARLNYFTDETSYNFTDMVREIGKFTATGQKLEDATTAMMGIASWAALSGKNASEASRAMYQLSQALGSGRIRREDWRSIQNLNMDTKEFRQNAIEAAIELGTLKETADGVYTTLVGAKANKLSFTVQQFADRLTEGEWFTADVMMKVFGQYSEAVDEIRAIYEEGEYKGKKIETTAQAVREVKETNRKLIAEFKDTELSTKDINAILSRWKKVEKVTDITVDNYAEINGLTKEQAELEKKEKDAGYAEYLKEYAEIFKGTEEEAEEALTNWQDYVSEFGIKAFLSAQEAKTFLEAIESAKDAASTVWTTIYTNIFGNYDEAKEIWTDLANALYEIFVNRLWDINDIFEYWRRGEMAQAKQDLEDYEAEYERLMRRTKWTREEVERMNFLKQQIEQLHNDIENNIFRDGRRILFQGLYAFGNGLKSTILNFREAWNGLFEENQSGKSLIEFSEKVRIAGFNFYQMMKELGETDFYKNIAQSIYNLLAPFRAIKTIVSGLIKAFLPAGESFQSFLVRLSAGIKNLTARLVPSRDTIVSIYKILRGAIAVVKLVFKAAYGLYIMFIKPIVDSILDGINLIFTSLLKIGAKIGDDIYKLEEALGPMEAMYFIGSRIRNLLGGIFTIIGKIIGLILRVLEPVLSFIVGLVGEIYRKIQGIFTGENAGFIDTLIEKVTNLANRLKDAWFSAESLSDVFGRFREGTGLSNFLLLISEIAQNVFERIVAVIGAIFGLESTVNNSAASGILSKIKTVVQTAMQVLLWLFTNVIKPTFSVFIEGFAAIIRQLGEAWRTGDIKYFLDTLKTIFKTLSSLEIFRLLKSLAKILGSGGLLRVFRNSTKALKGVYKYFTARANNENATAVMKLVISLTLLFGVLSAMTFLPTENLDKMKNLLIVAGIAIAVLIGSLVLLSKSANDSAWGLIGMSVALLSMIGLVVILMVAVKKLSNLFKNLFVIDEKTGKAKASGWDIAAAFLPFLGFLTVLFIVLRVMRRMGSDNALTNFAISLAAIAGSVALMVIALNQIDDYLTNTNYDIGRIIEALFVIFSLVTFLAIGIRIMLRGITGFKMGSITSGFGAALAIVAMVWSVCAILVPTLENLVDISENFDKYLQAVFTISLAIVSIGATFFLMTAHGTGFRILAAAFIFRMMIFLIRDTIIPMMNLLYNIDYNGYIAGVTLFRSFAVSIMIIILSAVLSITYFLRTVVRTVKENDSKVNVAGLLATLAVTLIGVFAGITLVLMVMKHFFINQGDTGLGIALLVGTVVLVGALLVTTFLIIGNFIEKLGDIAKAIPKESMDSISDIMGYIFGIMVTIFGGLALLITVNRLAYGNNYLDTLVGVIATLGPVVATIIVLCKFFGELIHKIYANTHSGSVSNNNYNEANKAMVDMLKMIFAIVVAIFGGTALMGIVNTIGMGINDGWFILAQLTTIAAVVGAIWALCTIFGNFIEKVAGLELDDEKISLIKFISVMMTVMYTVISVVASICIKILSDTRAGQLIASGFIYLINIVGIIVSLLGMTSLLVKNLADAEITKGKITIILGTLASVVLVMLTSIFLINALSEANITGLETVAAVMITVVGIIASVFGAVMIMCNTLLGMEFKPATVAIVIASLFAAGSLLWLVSTILLPALQSIANVPWETILASLGGVAAIILAVGAIITLISFVPQIAAQGFLISATEITAGLLSIAAAVTALAGACLLLREVFDPGSTMLSGFRKLGNNVAEGYAQGIKEGTGEVNNAIDYMSDESHDELVTDNKSGSPARRYIPDGKNVDLGFAKGITKYAKVDSKAIKSMALLTNEDFQDALGIASPSKVFYENGRFVVQGFMNGINDEYSKNKAIGSAIGDGIAGSLEESLEGVKDSLSSIWDVDMSTDIEEWFKNAGKSASEAFGLDFLEDKDPVVEYTEEETAQLEELYKKRDEIIESYNSNGPMSTQDAINMQNELKPITDAIAHIESVAKQRAEESSGNVITQVLNKLKNGLAGMGSDPGVLAGLGGGITQLLGEAGTKIKGWFNGESDCKVDGEGFGDVLTNGINSVKSTITGLGGDAGNEFIGGIADALKSDGTIGSALYNTLDKAFDAIKNSSIARGIMKAANWFGIVSNEDYLAYMADINLAARSEEIEDLKKRKKEFEDLFYKSSNTGEKDYYRQQITDLENEIEDIEKEATGNIKTAGEEITEEIVEAHDDMIDAAVGNQKKGMWNIGFSEMIEVTKKGNMPSYEDAFDKAFGDMLEWFATPSESQKKILEFLYSNSIDKISDNVVSFKNGETYKITSSFNSLIERLNKELPPSKQITSNSEEISRLFILGLEQGWIKYENDMFVITKDFTGEFISTVMDGLGEHSPSVIARGMMKNFFIGFEIGADEESDEVLKMLAEYAAAMVNGTYESLEKTNKKYDDSTLTQLAMKVYNAIGMLSDTDYDEYLYGIGKAGQEVSESLNLLYNALEIVKESMEEDIQPTVTPIIDDTNVQTWFDTMSSTITGLNPKFDAVINSFGNAGYDYTPEFETLEKKLDTMTQLVCDAIINSSEDTNVNINIEPDGDGLFNYMVNQAKMRNKRVPGSGFFG